MTSEKKIKLITLSIISVFFIFTNGCVDDQKKEEQFDLATNAVVNATLLTNPISSVYMKKDDKSARVSAGYEITITGCPMVSFQGSLIPFIGSQKISVEYEEDCLPLGFAISGGFTGQWSFKLSRLKLYLDMLLTIENMKIEGLTTDGRINALASIDRNGPYALLDGYIKTTHSDGRFRELTLDNMTAVVDFNDKIFDLFFENDKDLDNGSILDPFDDLLILDGSAVYTSEDNMTSAVYIDSLTHSYFCFFPVSGTMKIINEEEGFEALIDFGDGQCNSTVSITIEGETREIDIEIWLKEQE